MISRHPRGGTVTAFIAGPIYCFGKTAWRRRADGLVVFGAPAYADGRPSAGDEAYTVATRERYTLTTILLLIAREVVAIWYYVLTA